MVVSGRVRDRADDSRRSGLRIDQRERFAGGFVRAASPCTQSGKEAAVGKQCTRSVRALTQLADLGLPLAWAAPLWTPPTLAPHQAAPRGKRSNARARSGLP